MSFPTFKLPIFDITDAEIVLNSDIAVFTSRVEVSPAFFPGQPISFTWSYWDSWGDNGRVNLTNAIIRAKIMLSNRIDQVYLSLDFKYIKGGISELVSAIPVPFQWFYKFNLFQTILLQVSILNNNTTDIYEATGKLSIISEDVYDWLEFLPLTSTEKLPGSRSATPIVAWKENYIISARFNNKSQFSAMTGTASLYENPSGSTIRTFRGTVNLNVNSNGNVQLDFPAIKQDWAWLVPKIWIFYGDTFRLFEYHIVLSLNDSYNNSYSDVEFGPFLMGVRLSDKKQALGGGANAAIVLSVILYALSWIITQAPGHAAQALADGLGGAALDPPEPDPNYLRRVKFGPKKISFAKIPISNIQALGQFLESCSIIALGSVTLSKIEGRILGAEEAKSKAGINMQKKHYTEILRTMMASSTDLQNLASVVADALEDLKESDKIRTDKIIKKWIKGDVESDFQDKNSNERLSKETVKMIRMAISDSECVNNINKGMGYTIKTLASSLHDYCQKMLQYSSGFIKLKSIRARDSKRTR